jgi:competence protein ComGC
MTDKKSDGICKRRRSGFTIVQLLVVLSMLSVLAALGWRTVNSGRAAAQRVQCDIRLKAIALALDAYRQANGRYPAMLQGLREDGYLRETDALHCAADPRPEGSYAEYYAVRGPRESSELPCVLCPFHEASGRGAQVRLGRYTTQYKAFTAVLSGGNDVSVQSPGQKAMAGTVGMTLHGGDIIRTGNLGAATIVFSDGSTAQLRRGSQVTVLQSFLDGHTQAPLYTVVSQQVGRVLYTVHHGSKFDVVTPTATAGAHGTQFLVDLRAATPSVTVYEGKVSLSTSLRAGLIPPSFLGLPYLITPQLPNLLGLLGL